MLIWGDVIPHKPQLKTSAILRFAQLTTFSIIKLPIFSLCHALFVFNAKRVYANLKRICGFFPPLALSEVRV